MSWRWLVLLHIPLFYFVPQNKSIFLFQILICFLWIYLIKNKNKNIIFCFLILLTIVGNMISSSLLKLPNNINKERFIWSNRITEEKIIEQQEESMYLKFRFRPIVWNKSIFIYNTTDNLFRFFSIKNLIDVLSVIVFVGVIKGFEVILKSKNKLNAIYGLILIGISLLVAGINKSPDKFNNWYLSLPIFLYFGAIGIKKMNNKLFVILLLISIFLLPIIR